ncbi:MAG: DUF4325 domain-containing protein [Lachnospiraceae bacterium]|nr:DUF4325 domain-containing protein [Lachnospiraceae bacterium]
MKTINKKEVRLNFGKATTRLAGNPYGREVFEKQAKQIIDYNAENTVIFPDTIEKVASSFVQGFFAEIIEKIGYAKFDEVIKIKAQNEELENDIHDDLLY